MVSGRTKSSSDRLILVPQKPWRPKLFCRRGLRSHAPAGKRSKLPAAPRLGSARGPAGCSIQGVWGTKVQVVLKEFIWALKGGGERRGSRFGSWDRPCSYGGSRLPMGRSSGSSRVSKCGGPWRSLFSPDARGSSAQKLPRSSRCTQECEHPFWLCPAAANRAASLPAAANLGRLRTVSLSRSKRSF